METNVNYTVVGLFVIVLTAAIVLAIIWLSSGLSFEGYNYYRIYMTESVSGLSLDSAVEYNGVNVGNVSEIKLNRNNPELVELIVRIKKRTPVTRGTVATLLTRGFTGITFVALQDKGSDLRPLLPLPGQRLAVIPSSPSIFMRIETALAEFTKNFKNISERLQLLLDDSNLQQFKGILANLNVVTGNLAKNTDRINSILLNTETATRSIPPFMQSGTRAIRTFQSQTLPGAYRTLNNLDDVIRTLSEVANELKQNPSILIRGSARQPTGPGER